MEPQDEAFIRTMIDQGYATEEQTLVHQGNLMWRTGSAIRPPEELEAAQPTRRMLFQTVPEAKLEARGATFLWTASEGPHEWHTMADPEGDGFCISRGDY